MVLLGKIEDMFKISGRGLVITPELSDSLDPNLKLYVGEAIQLRAPGGLVVETKIRGIEFLRTIVRHKASKIGLLLPTDADHQLLSKGMEIWLLRDN
jgi:hypothetical protein